MNEPIQPKPTEYRGITFRSRLEARWAVCLDWYQLITAWKYEPTSYKYAEHGSTWSPDFYVKSELFNGLLEVKPVMPTLEYLTTVALAAVQMRVPIYLAYGDFFNGVPSIFKIDLQTLDQIKATPITSTPFLPRIKVPAAVAAGYRFDLPNQPVPPFRDPPAGQMREHLSRFVSQERQRNLRRAAKNA
jgi:hypothetical protein